MAHQVMIHMRSSSWIFDDARRCCPIHLYLLTDVQALFTSTASVLTRLMQIRHDQTCPTTTTHLMLLDLLLPAGLFLETLMGYGTGSGLD